ATGDWFYVEYRRPIGFDSGVGNSPNIMNGVVVHYWDGQRDGIYLLDMTPSTSTWADPALTVGSSFVDTAGGGTITPSWADGPTAGISIPIGTACVHRAPPVTLAPTQQSGAAGTALAYTLSVRSNDTGCGGSSFTIAATAPTGWSLSIGASSLTVPDG